MSSIKKEESKILLPNDIGESIKLFLKKDNAFSDLYVSFRRALVPGREKRSTRQNIVYQINKQLQR